MEEEDIDDLWEDVRPRPLGTPKPALPPAPPMPPSVLVDLAAEIRKKYHQQPVTCEMLADCILTGIRMYFEQNPDGVGVNTRGDAGSRSRG